MKQAAHQCLRSALPRSKSVIDHMAPGYALRLADRAPTGIAP